MPSNTSMNGRIVGDDDGGTILVVLAVAKSGNFSVFDLHSELSLECSVAETNGQSRDKGGIMPISRIKKRDRYGTTGDRYRCYTA